MTSDSAHRRQFVGTFQVPGEAPQQVVLTAVERPTLESSTTWDPGSIAVGGAAGTDVTLSGAALGDFAMASLSVDPQDLVISAAVDAADNVRVTLANNTAGAIDLASHTVRVKVWKPSV
jgi:hypothetical protein